MIQNATPWIAMCKPILHRSFHRGLHLRLVLPELRFTSANRTAQFSHNLLVVISTSKMNTYAFITQTQIIEKGG